jgi:hypothetical protein
MIIYKQIQPNLANNKKGEGEEKKIEKNPCIFGLPYSTVYKKI